MFADDLKRTLRAWRAQPLLPITALAMTFVTVASAVGIWMASPVGGLVVLLPICLFALGFLGTERVWYVWAWEGHRPRPRELFDLTLSFIAPYVALGLLGLGIGMALVLPLLLVVDGVAVAVIALLAVDVLLTFATAAVAVERESPPLALVTSWRMVLRGLPRCLPYVLLPPLLLYALSAGRLWLWLLPVAELVALAARGVTTSYFVREMAIPDVPRELVRRDPALYG